MPDKPTFYVDELHSYQSGRWCHLWTDGTPEQLDAFADVGLGLHKEWAHTSHGAFVRVFYHYDLKPSKRSLAIALGAEELPLREWVKQHQHQHQHQHSGRQ